MISPPTLHLERLYYTFELRFNEQEDKNFQRKISHIVRKREESRRNYLKTQRSADIFPKNLLRGSKENIAISTTISFLPRVEYFLIERRQNRASNATGLEESQWQFTLYSK